MKYSNSIVFRSSYDNYEALISKLAKMLEDNGFVLIKNTRAKPCLNTNRRHIEQVFGDLKCSELKEYSTLLDNFLNKDN